MILTVKNRSALLDKDLRIVPEDTTKDFFTYFDFSATALSISCTPTSGSGSSIW